MSASAECRLIARSGLFDANYYLIEASDVVANGCDPLEHFCRFGVHEGRRPNLYFDPVWYSRLYLSEMSNKINPLLHYIEIGERAGFRPVAYFEPDWYVRTYKLRRSNLALQHYLTHRRSQRYAPNAMFDLARYLARYGAEIGSNRDAFAHHLRHGARRDLDTTLDFDTAAYRARYSLSNTPASPLLVDREVCIPLVHCLKQQAVDEHLQRAAEG